MYLDKLPIGSHGIDWSKSIDKYVHFKYNTVEGDIYIKNYNKATQNLTVIYNNKESEIKAYGFKGCHIGNIINVIHDKYIYDIGDVVDTASGSLLILDQMLYKKEQTKGYKYKCLIDGHIGNIRQTCLLKKSGCPVCSNKKVMAGVNDMWTTNPELAKLLANPEDGYKYMQTSSKRVDWKCPNCGEIIKSKTIANVHKKGLSCPICSDGISYPEKVMFNVLKQLKIYFIYQFSKSNNKWCNNYKYDFYLPNYNCIIETHGIQHYSDCKFNKTSISCKDTQKNDREKEQLAKKNGISHYIIINCKYSKLDFIKNNILNSELCNIFELKMIDWFKVESNAQSSLVKQVCFLYNQGIKDTKELGIEFGLNRATIIRYLTVGDKLNWISYSGSRKRIICTTTEECFESISAAVKKYNFKSHTGIINCCKGIIKYAGKLPNGTKLCWEYIDN